MAKNLLHCETGFGVYRSTQLGHIPFFLLLYLLVGPSIEFVGIFKQRFCVLRTPARIHRDNALAQKDVGRCVIHCQHF
jgi:hypothetical protein